MRTHGKVMSIAAASLLILCVLLQGAALAVTKSVSYNAVSIPYTKTDWTSTLLVQQFDPSLGTLFRMDLSVTGLIRTTLTVTNDATSASQGNAKTHVEVTAKDPGNLLTLMPDIYSDAFNYTLDPGQVVTSGLLSKTNTVSGSYTLANILNEFTGTGLQNINVSTFTETVLANTGGNTSASQVTDASAQATVTYWYQAVPEPSSLAALAGGLLGLGAVIRRRK